LVKKTVINMNISEDIQKIIEQMDQGVQISAEELQYITVWYTQEIQKLGDTIQITNIKKEIENL